jgi:divalent metal cation (Fe/Co/Zn/Cd) transporter
MIVAIPALGFNPLFATGIFLILFALATLIIIYSALMYRKKRDKKKKLTKEAQLYKSIDSILGLITLTAYLLISFMTMAWHITWIMWIIYALISQIVKLIIMLATGNSVDECGEEDCCHEK